MKILGAAILCATVVALGGFVSRSETNPGPAHTSAIHSATTTSVVHGLKITLTTPFQSYPWGSLVNATVSLRNVSSHVILLADSNCEGTVPHTEVLTRDGKLLPPPTPTLALPCPYQVPVKLQPGKMLVTESIAWLRGPKLRAVAAVAKSDGSIRPELGKILDLTLTAASPDQVSFSRTASGQYRATFARPLGATGSFRYIGFERCTQANGLGSDQGSLPWDWLSSNSDTVHTTALNSRCVRERWDLVAGWPGYPAGHVNFSVNQG